MAPIKKRCCIPYCNNSRDLPNKQLFKIGAHSDGNEKFLIRSVRSTLAKSQGLYCCEDHFDLPNDSENYIKYKYAPGTKLKLRPTAVPQKKLPINVCRICLNLIFNENDFVNVGDGENAKIIASCLPEIDLSLTTEPVACVRCFNPLKMFNEIKKKVLKSEVTVVNCIKSIAKNAPSKLIKSCEIDLFEEYEKVKKIMKNEGNLESEAKHEEQGEYEPAMEIPGQNEEPKYCGNEKEDLEST